MKMTQGTLAVNDSGRKVNDTKYTNQSESDITLTEGIRVSTYGKF